MALYLDANDRLHNDQDANLALTCPHCEVLSHVAPIAVPRFAELQAHRPQQVGVVYRCDACNEPIFLRHAARSYGAQRIELAAQFVEVERPREKFSLTYLPEEIDALFREALTCYSHCLYDAFASMCRRTAQATFDNLGETGKLQLFDQLNEVREMAELDTDTFLLVKRVLFGTDADPRPSPPRVDERQASVLLEVMKDLLYQVYVRKGRLQHAMLVRRFFAGEHAERANGAEPPPGPASDDAQR